MPINIKEISKSLSLALCKGNSPVIGEFSSQMTSNAEKSSMWWRHHKNGFILGCYLLTKSVCKLYFPIRCWLYVAGVSRGNTRSTQILLTVFGEHVMIRTASRKDGPTVLPQTSIWWFGHTISRLLKFSYLPKLYSCVILYTHVLL